MYCPLSTRINPSAICSFGVSSIWYFGGPLNSDSHLLQKYLCMSFSSSFPTGARKYLSTFGTNFDLVASSSDNSAIT